MKKRSASTPGDNHSKNDPTYRRVRLEDIATRCGTSLSTVSRALSGDKGVSAELRNKIQEMARAVRYTPAQEIGGSKIVLAASQVAMLDYYRYQFSWYVLQGLKERAKMLGIEIITHPLSEAGASQLSALMADPAIGGLLALTVDDLEILNTVVSLNKPAVLVNSDDPLMRLSSVLPCNRSATRLAADYLVQQGHRNIIFLTHPGRRTIEQRLEGWRDAMLHYHLSCDTTQVITVADWLPELAEQAVMDYIQRHQTPFSAILCANDSLAIGAIGALNKLGISVPDDVSVMGMNDLPQAEFTQPELTTVHLPVQEIGVVALELLQDMIAGTVQIPRRVELACSLIERQSVAKKPPAST
ncbi:MULTISPECIES: LacI family DNA-binding transcriptional regulator [Brenneria]|uniref:LacI family transcriptional regulator n=1 Tax=Brenneria nigrifluens DSM 30175 = ATCC 13028 TaxID=1121120 RepID=A0A2U1ULQ6_9GAMM|nr:MULTISPECIES: LacI family DNA-binding transcriptional regulator [Brenneria]PWC22588.1 LacI family transcriptional regulator [Brenneria nigrifluens DSM 30175 = ATCC 13028]QCR02818.1 LacI family transcriptional regulator [Brenneria nigrifluens DSM 30175 = ATCC 13028]